MRSRLTALALVLVILPTAVVSIMAARMMGGWETVLRRRLEGRAGDVIRDAAGRVNARLHDDLVELQSAMADCLHNKGSAVEIGATASRICASRPMVHKAYLFMPPFEFIYPEPPVTTEPAGTPRGTSGGASDADLSPREALKNELRRAISEAKSLRVEVAVAVAGRSYCFAPVPGRREFYVGYEIDDREFQKQLSDVLDGYGDSGFKLLAEGPGLNLPARHMVPRGEVVVTDSLGTEPGGEERSADRNADRGTRAGRDEKAPMATGRLQPPFDDIRLSAFATDPEQIKRTSSMQARFYVIAIVVLSGGIVAGLSLVLWEAAGQIRQAKSRSEFVIGVSHDLRTPVASMKMLAETLYLERVRDPARRKMFLATIVKECERLHQLTERVLFFVRFGQKAPVQAVAEEDPVAVVEGAVDAFRARFAASAEDNDSARAKGRAARVAVDAPGKGEIPRIRVDRGAMTQVLLNLLDNAAKYGLVPDAPNAQAVIGVSVSCRQRKRFFFSRVRDWVCIAVADRGAGIPAPVLKRIFRRFYRGPGAERENLSGVGLGLALSRNVVIAHGGWMEAASEPGRGSRFSVFLPVVETR